MKGSGDIVKKRKGFSKNIGILSVCILFFCSLSTAQAHGNAAYGEVLENFYGFLTGQISEEAIGEAADGVAEVQQLVGREAALSYVGFAFLDINGDNEPELLIGGTAEQTLMPWYRGELYAVYGQAENPVCIVSGRTRCRWYLLNGGSLFYNVGSNGASQSSFGIYELSCDANGWHLSPQEFYFTDEPLSSRGEPSCYFNRTGEWNRAASERTDISMTAFERMQNAWEAQTRQIEFIPFSSYIPATANDSAYEGLSEKEPTGET